ncbi:MAG: L-2-amino-thiazoline-4-carboxylic acid hydrolase [Anaerolineales bacterium]
MKIPSLAAELKAVRRKSINLRKERMTWDLRFQKETLRRIRSRLDDQGLLGSGELFRKIDNEIERNIVEYSHLLVDEKTHPHLRLTACVLASYQALTSGLLDRKQALELIEDVFVSTGRTTLKLYTQAILMFSKDPFIAITNAGKKRAMEQYGRAWEFRFEYTENSFTMTCIKCFYNDFFTASDSRYLTRIFCSWDENWIKPIDPRKHGILFRRPTTMGYGGKECPFIFNRVIASAG